MKGKSNFWIIGGLAVLVIYLVSTYNSLVQKDQAVESQWGQVETVYQRRADLIPALVNTAKGYAKHENSVFDNITKARSEAMQVKVDVSKLDEAQMKKFQETQGEISQALSRLIALREAYPDLKANKNFEILMSQLEGTENRITVERRKYNDVTRVFNNAVLTFPRNLFAGIFGFSKKPYFQSEAGAEKAPKVEF